MIGYYVHHHGRGHLEMARCVAAWLTGNVTGLSSLARPAGWPGQWLRLPRDDTAETAMEPAARGQLHWAPLGDQGLRDRMAAIAGWIQRAAPSVLVVDVSVEVTALARLMGVPVVSVVLPGRRGEPAHRFGHALAEALIAPWPASLPPESGWTARARRLTRSATWARSPDSTGARPSPALPVAAARFQWSCCPAAADPG